jgi:hypothetical protein
VAAIDSQLRTDHRHLPKYELWRQKIARAFRWQHLVGVPEIAYVRVDYGRKADSGAVGFGKYAGLLTINCVCREPRGIGV